MKQNYFNFLMISAMYENGGNTTQRLLDGHPQLYVYPFESQLGTKYVADYLSSLYPIKYRWPILPSSLTAEEIYYSIIDEECKIRANTPNVSKFKDIDFDFSDNNRLKIFINLLKLKSLTRANIIEAFFKSTFEAWKNYSSSGLEKFYVGYSPIIGVDGEKIIKDFNGNSFILHIIRNPFSAYADTKKRPLPLSIDHYLLGWVTCQYYANLYKLKFPNNFFILRYEDIIKNPKQALSKILKKLDLKTNNSLKYPSWNKKKLEEIYPWGTIKIATEEQNIKTAKELNKEEINLIYKTLNNYIKLFSYDKIYQKLSN